MRLILASASPRRAELLRAAGYDFDVVTADVDESIRDGESPSIYVRRLAAEKSAAVMARIVTGPAEAGHHGDHGPAKAGHYEKTDVIVLGADTTVVVDGEMLGKPTDAADSARMLARLSGREHQVLTGISLRRGAFEIGRVEATSVAFVPLTEDEIAWYVATGEGRDKAGAYAIQGFASRFIPRIEGSYSNVVGLPVSCVRELLREISDTPRGRSSPRRSGAD
ncbi:MAG TPA: Maf family protein [Vicinamibacterales bacterium]|nr:Maf family protein [Vicinamibacterales bacterium]